MTTGAGISKTASAMLESGDESVSMGSQCVYMGEAWGLQRGPGLSSK